MKKHILKLLVYTIGILTLCSINTFAIETGSDIIDNPLVQEHSFNTSVSTENLETFESSNFLDNHNEETITSVPSDIAPDSYIQEEMLNIIEITEGADEYSTNNSIVSPSSNDIYKSGNYNASYGYSRIMVVGFDLNFQFDWNIKTNSNGDYIFVPTNEKPIYNFTSSMSKNTAAATVYRAISITENYATYTISGDRRSVVVNVSYTLSYTDKRTSERHSRNYVDSFTITTDDL